MAKPRNTTDRWDNPPLEDFILSTAFVATAGGYSETGGSVGAGSFVLHLKHGDLHYDIAIPAVRRNSGMHFVGDPKLVRIL